MTRLSFDLRDCTNVTGLATGAHIGSWDHHLPVSLVPAFGSLLILNGSESNFKITAPINVTGSTAAWPLVGNAPYGKLYPTVTPMGTGNVKGSNYKWKFRYKASSTGEVTGFSAINVTGLNLGMQLGSTTNWIGQNALFQLPSRTGFDAAYFDRIQLFRNTTNEFSIYYLVKEQAGTSGAIYFLDDVPDESLLLSGVETDGLVPNPSHASGPPWPCVKSYAHPSGRFLTYGILPMPPFRNGTATVVASAEYVSITSDYAVALGVPKVPPGRVGQSFVPLATSGGTTITPTQTYRVCAIGPGTEGDVDITPAWAEGALSAFHYQIIDDRDGRLVFVSEPGLPSQYNYLKILAVGADRTDRVLHIWGFRGRRFSISKRHVYVWENDDLVDPTAVVAHREVADEGACGLWAMAETPLGLVYVNEKLGVRLFSGVSNFVGVEPPVPLGGSGPEQEFMPRSQFRGIDPDYMERTRVFYDSEHHQVFVSYCPIGGGGHEETLCYDMPSVNWRGPWRMHLTAAFQLLDDGGALRSCFGDEFGNILTADEAALDVLNRATGQAITGTVSTVDSAMFFTAASAAFDPASDVRVVGCPIVFNDGAGNEYVNWIASYSGLQFGLLYTPSPVLAAGWTFTIAGIKWQMKTSLINGGDGVQPAKFEKLRMNFTRGHTGDSTAKLGVGVNGGTTFITETQDDGSTETLIDPARDADGTGEDGSDYTEGRVQRSGRMFQIRLRGTSTTNDPQVTIAVADIEVDGGA